MFAAAAIAFALVQAADPASAAAAPAPAAASPGQRLAAGTLLEVELTEKLSSDTSHVGDKFGLRLAEPVVVGGVTLLTAGAIGQGEVIDASHSGMSGSQGKLIISARFLELNGRHVRIRGMTMGAGKSHVTMASEVALLPYVGVASMFIKGGKIEFPEGARATVKLAEDLDLAPAASAGPAAGGQTPSTQPSGT